MDKVGVVWLKAYAIGIGYGQCTLGRIKDKKKQILLAVLIKTIKETVYSL